MGNAEYMGAEAKDTAKTDKVVKEDVQKTMHESPLKAVKAADKVVKSIPAVKKMVKKSSKKADVVKAAKEADAKEAAAAAARKNAEKNMGMWRSAEAGAKKQEAVAAVRKAAAVKA